MLSVERLLPGHRFLWLAFFATILAAWAALFAMQAATVQSPMTGQGLFVFPEDARGASLAYLISLCTLTPADAGYASALVMWSLMSLAMMAPTAFPAMRTYADLTHTDAAGGLSFAALIAGYLAVWFGFSLLAAYLQVRLAQAGLLTPYGRSVSGPLNGSLLILAGLYQFSPLKEACLSACQSPMAFFLGRWQPGASGGLKLGLRLGAVCLGCCWALMLLAFIAGTMNLLFMGLAMVLMTLEKLPSIGRRISAPIGVFLCLAGAVAIALPLVTP